MGDVAGVSFVFPAPHEGDEIDKYIQNIIYTKPLINSGDGFASLFADIRANDLILPRLKGDLNYVQNMSIICTVCNAFDPGYSPSEYDMLNACNVPQSNQTEIYLEKIIPFVDSWGNQNAIAIPEPIDTRDMESRYMVCALIAYMSTTDYWTDEQDKAFSQVFWAKNEPRKESQEPGASPTPVQHVYDYFYPLGQPTQTSYPYPTITQPAKPKCEGSGRMKSCEGDGKWNGMSVGARVGIIIGVLVGFAMGVALLWFCFKKTRARQSLTSTSASPSQPEMALTNYQIRQQRDREARMAINARLLARSQNAGSQGIARDVDAYRNAAFTRADAGDAGDKPPPAYGEVVNDQEAMLAQCAIRRDRRSDGAPPYVAPVEERPPEYPAAVAGSSGAGSLPNSRVGSSV